jgi:crotonobetainyl-CoA:carnitine CoA-transferase CaiB-like acyl-CoA transferase
MMYRVVELGHVVAAPFAGEVLAQLGFDVVKVEPIGGDPTRRDDVLGDSMFVYFNRGKRSLALDLRSAEGREVFLRLLGSSHVLIENFAPGAMERLGLGRDLMFKVNPKLVYCSIKGYPQGEYRDWPAFGTLVEAISGVMWSNGSSPSRLPASITDMGAGMYCVINVLWALLNNRPGFYEVTLYQSSVAWLGYYIIAYQTLGKLFPGTGDKLPFWAPYELFETADGRYVYIAVNNDERWVRLCRVLGLDPGAFGSNAERVRRRDEVHRMVQSVIIKYRLEDILNLLISNDIPAAPLMSIPDIMSSGIPEWEGVRRDGGDIRVPRLPVPGSLVDRGIPRVGEHTQEILRELGYDDDYIRSLAVRNVIRV